MSQIFSIGFRSGLYAPLIAFGPESDETHDFLCTGTLFCRNTKSGKFKCRLYWFKTSKYTEMLSVAGFLTNIVLPSDLLPPEASWTFGLCLVSVFLGEKRTPFFLNNRPTPSLFKRTRVLSESETFFQRPSSHPVTIQNDKAKSEQTTIEDFSPCSS